MRNSHFRSFVQKVHYNKSIENSFNSLLLVNYTKTLYLYIFIKQLAMEKHNFFIYSVRLFRLPILFYEYGY